IPAFLASVSICTVAHAPPTGRASDRSPALTIIRVASVMMRPPPSRVTSQETHSAGRILLHFGLAAQQSGERAGEAPYVSSTRTRACSRAFFLQAGLEG